MNKKTMVAAAAAAVMSVSMLFQVAAAGSDPGSSTDPLVTKSYVDQSISNLMTALSGSSSGTGTAAVPVYEPVQLTYGQKLRGGEGAEIIMRSGSGKCFSAVESGLVDVTGGREIFHGQSVEQNHMLIVSRDDGRGVEVTSDDAWFIVRGNYSIE